MMITLTLLLFACPAQDLTGAPTALVPTVATVTQDAPATHGENLHLYPIGDLTGQDRLEGLAGDIFSGTLSDEGRVAALDRYVKLAAEGGIGDTTTSLVEAVRELIQPPFQGTWQRVESIGGASLAVFGSEAQQAWMRSFLGATRSFDGMIQVEAQIYRLPLGSLPQLVEGRTAQVLGDGERQILSQKLGVLPDVQTVTNQRVAVRPFQRAHVSVTNQTAYVRDYELTILPGRDEEIVDPVIDVLQTGLTMQWRSVPLAEKRLAIQIDLTYSTVRRPFREVAMRLGALGHEVTVQLPEVTTLSAQSRFDLAPGQTIVMGTVDPGSGGPNGGDDEAREILLILGVTCVAEKDITEPFGRR